MFEKDLSHRPKRRIFLPAAVDSVDAWLAFARVEEQLVVVAAALAAGAFGAQGQAVVAAQLHAGVVPAQVAVWVRRGTAGAAGQGQGEGQQGEGLGLGHDGQVRWSIVGSGATPEGREAGGQRATSLLMIWGADDTPLRRWGISLVLPDRASSRVNPLPQGSCECGNLRKEILNHGAKSFWVWMLRKYPTRAAEVSLLSGKWLTDTVFGSLRRPGVRARL